MPEYDDHTTPLTTHDVAKQLDVSPEMVRHWAQVGAIALWATTPGGLRLFRQRDVNQLAARRARARHPKLLADIRPRMLRAGPPRPRQYVLRFEAKVAVEDPQAKGIRSSNKARGIA